MAKDVEDQVIEEIKKSVYFAIQLTNQLTWVTVPFCFASWDIKKLISRKNFIVALTYLVGPPAQRYLGLLISSFLNIAWTGANAPEYVRTELQIWLDVVLVWLQKKEVAHKEMYATHCIINREHLSAKKCRLN